MDGAALTSSCVFGGDLESQVQILPKTAPSSESADQKICPVSFSRIKGYVTSPLNVEAKLCFDNSGESIRAELRAGPRDRSMVF